MNQFRTPQRRNRRLQAAARGLSAEVPLIETSVPGETPMPVSGDIQVPSDVYGYSFPQGQGGSGPGTRGDSAGAAHTSLRAPAGATVEISAIVSTMDGLHTRLLITPSEGEGPIYEESKAGPWRAGKDMEMSLTYQVPSSAKYIGFGLDQPNKDYDDGTRPAAKLPQSARSGRLVWQDFQIRQLPPSAEAGMNAGMGSITTLVALGVGGVAVQQFVSRYL